MPRSNARAQGGFVITLELVLIFTILGIGLLVGIVAVRNALFVYWQKKQAQQVWVYDNSDPVRILGPVRDFDEHEAPRLFFIDRELSDPAGDPGPVGADPAWMGSNYRAFVGVRDDRFTSRHRIFYRGSYTCGADGVIEPCIVAAGEEDGDNLGVGTIAVEVVDGGGGSATGTARISNAGGIGYLYPLQNGGPSYGIGRDEGSPVDPLFATGFPGTLYRATDTSCNPADVRSAWTSQSVVSGEPCEPLPGGVTVDAAKCPDGRAGINIGDMCLPPADPRCVTESGGGAGTCSTDGSACTLDSQCLRCTGNTAVSCTVGGTQCNGTCAIGGASCATSADCGGTVAGACSLSGTACFSNADCPAACSISGALCFGNNSLCAPVAQNGSCTPQSCVGAVVNTCNGAIGPCAGSCSGVGGGLVCACPTGWIDYGANCCPPGTIQITPGQCTIGNTGFVVEAIPVGSFNEIEYTYPFRVNLPPDPASFELLAPGGSEGAPGVPTGIPWDPSGPIDFESPQPDGMEGPP